MLCALCYVRAGGGVVRCRLRGIAVAWWHLHDPDMLSRLLIVLVVLWFLAWFRIVGALWRSSVVAACLLCAVLITAHRLQLTGHAP